MSGRVFFFKHILKHFQERPPRRHVVAAIFSKCIFNIHPAPAAEGAAPPKNQGNREAGSAIYATAAVPIFDHVFFALHRGVPVSNCFNGFLSALTKNSLEDHMSKFHLVKNDGTLKIVILGPSTRSAAAPPSPTRFPRFFSTFPSS